MRVCLTRFSDMLDGDRTANLLGGMEIDEEDDDEAYLSTTVKFVPIDMDWYWTDGDSQHAMDNLNRMNELNQAIEDLMQPYIHWVEDALRVKCCYEKLLTDYLHIKHGFLTEADLAKQFASYFKTESMAAMAHSIMLSSGSRTVNLCNHRPGAEMIRVRKLSCLPANLISS